MKKMLIFIVLVSLAFALWLFVGKSSITGAPPYGVADNPPAESEVEGLYDDWVRPEGPVKVALQAGHWKNDEVPDELHRLRGNTGATGGGKSEWEVNYEIASLTKDILESKGIVVEILPATIPPKYWADIFVAIHSDGSEDPNMTGFKLAYSRRDLTKNSDDLLLSIEKEYQLSTGLNIDTNVSRNMRGYYAFGWWRYDHSLHPMTTSVILETGFLTSPTDRTIIVARPELSADGLANGIINYLISKKLIEG